MTCRNCGKEILDGSVFCPHCGATQASAPESAQNTTPAWEGPEGGKKKTGLFIGIGVAVAAVITVVALLVSGVFSNPKKQVEAAFVKSAAAYTAAEKALGLPDTAQWQKDQKITQLMGLELESINSDLVGYDLSALNGLGLGFRTGFSGADRLMSCDLSAFWGEEALINISIKAEDDALYLSSPQLTGEVDYGVNTETLGADLTKLTGDDSMEGLSFNLFDLVDLALEKMDQEKLKQDVVSATKSLWDQAEVKKTGSKTVNLNGTDTKTTAYQVTVPQEALDQYVDDLETALSALNYYELYQEMFQSMGMPQEEVQEFLDALENMDPYGELANSLRDAIAEFGDLELEVCLSGGYVSAVRYDDGAFVLISLYLGGGEEYVDNLVLDISINDQTIVVESTGDHGGKSGAFTDTTTVKGSLLGLTSLNSDFRYEPKKSDDNFTWELSIPSMGSLDMAGTLTAQADSISLDLSDVTLKAMGMEVCNLALRYNVSNAPGPWRQAENPKIITQMDQMELVMAILDVQSRAEAWTSEMEELFTSRLPEELLYGMMY